MNENFIFFDRYNKFIELGHAISDSNFFLTGATGVFGRWILNYFTWLHKNNFAKPRVTILSRQNKIDEYPFVNFINGDIKSFKYKKSKFDYLLHLAAPSANETFKGMDDLEKMEMLYSGAKNILNFASESILKRSLMVSSGALYGGNSNLNFKIDERAILAPHSTDKNSGLSLGKRISEFLFMQSNEKKLIDMSIARCFSFIGPGLPTEIHYAVGNFVQNACDNQPIIINGNGSPIRSYMHLGDMVYWLLTILFKGASGEDYNVGSEESISIINLARKVKKILNSSSKIIVKNNKNITPGNAINLFYVPNTKKARYELGLKEFSNLDNSIKDYGNYLNTKDRLS